MEVYFSKLKSLIDELVNYERISNYICGDLRAIIDYQDRDYVMKFFMNLDGEDLSGTNHNKPHRRSRIHEGSSHMNLETHDHKGNHHGYISLRGHMLTYMRGQIKTIHEEACPHGEKLMRTEFMVHLGYIDVISLCQVYQA